MFNPFSDSWKGPEAKPPIRWPSKKAPESDEPNPLTDINWKLVVGIAFAFWVLYLISGKT